VPVLVKSEPKNATMITITNDSAKAFQLNGFTIFLFLTIFDYLLDFDFTFGFVLVIEPSKNESKRDIRIEKIKFAAYHDSIK
jgi:hypothetical protein